MKSNLRQRKHLCAILVVHHKHKEGHRDANHYTPKGKHLTMDNCRLIERWKNENMSNRKIAGLLGKAPQTINNEVKRGTTLQQVRKGLYKKSILLTMHKRFTKLIENDR